MHLECVRQMTRDRDSVSVPATEAAARSMTLAADVYAVADSPSFDNSQMDGYAIPDTAEGVYQVGRTVPAGSDIDSLYPSGLEGRAAPVMTGAPLPTGTRAVVPVEACSPNEFVLEGAHVHVPATTEGRFIRSTGEDVRRGALIAGAGTGVGAPLAGALAAQGIAEVEVEQQARIVIVTGGAEVGGAGSSTVRDANGPILRTLAKRYGIDVVGAIATDDNPATLAAAIAHAVRELPPDAIVTSGGISHGAFEVVRQVFSNGWYGHVDQQPGGPQGLSTYSGIPVISLPGNPLSTLVSFRLYVAPVLGRAPEPVWVPLSKEVTGIPDKEQFARGRIVDGCVEPIGGAGSHLLVQSAGATCLLRIPANTRLSTDDLVRVYPL